jgi:hypothetical protein
VTAVGVAAVAQEGAEVGEAGVELARVDPPEADLDVATFVGESVVLEAEIRDGRARSVLGELALDGAAADGPARVLLRPEQLRLGAPGGAVPQARVRSVDFYGQVSRVWLDLPSGVHVSARLEGADIPAAGDEVTITVQGAVLPFPADPAGPQHLPEGTALAGTILDEEHPPEPARVP